MSLTFATPTPLEVEEIVLAEHDVSHLSTCRLGSDEIVKYFGRGMESYFQFIVFTGAMNLFLFLVTVAFIINEGVDQGSTAMASFLFLNVSGTTFHIFISIVSALLAISTFLWWRRSRSTPGHPGQRQQEQGLELETTANDDIISIFFNMKRRISPLALKIFRLVLLVLFVGLFFAYYYCQQAVQLWASTELSTLLGQTLMSLFFVLIDFIWRLSCSLITSLESHKYSTSYQESDCIKSFISRIIMFSIWGAVAPLTPPTVDHSSSSPFLTGGSRGAVAPQMINLLLVNTALGPFVDILSVYAYNKCCFFLCCGASSRDGDGEYKYKFNLPDEYTQLLFRQYLINQCLVFVPVAPLIGVLGCLLEWWTDKYKLVNLCKVPERHGNKFTTIIVSFLVINMLAIFFAYPNGVAF